jgi:hypothetical protein
MRVRRTGGKQGDALVAHLAAELLAQFPGPVFIYPWRRRLLLTVTSFVFFLTICCLLWALSRDSGRASFLGLAVLLSIAVLMFPRPALITLDRHGFRVKRIFLTQQFLWSEVNDFRAYRPGIRRWLSRAYKDRNPSVVFNINRSYISVAGLIYRVPGGKNGRLWDDYDVTIEDLAFLMNEWREMAVS